MQLTIAICFAHRKAKSKLLLGKTHVYWCAVPLCISVSMKLVYFSNNFFQNGKKGYYYFLGINQQRDETQTLRHMVRGASRVRPQIALRIFDHLSVHTNENI